MAHAACRCPEGGGVVGRPDIPVPECKTSLASKIHWTSCLAGVPVCPVAHQPPCFISFMLFHRSGIRSSSSIIKPSIHPHPHHPSSLHLSSSPFEHAAHSSVPAAAKLRRTSLPGSRYPSPYPSLPDPPGCLTSSDDRIARHH